MRNVTNKIGSLKQHIDSFGLEKNCDFAHLDSRKKNKNFTTDDFAVKSALDKIENERALKSKDYCRVKCFIDGAIMSPP